MRIAALAVTMSLAVASASAVAALDDKAAAAIMAKAACSACHAIDKKGVGPSYKDIAKKRKSEKNAAAALAKKVREGGGGAYGAVPMPPNPKSKISDEELKQMIEWVLSK